MSMTVGVAMERTVEKLRYSSLSRSCRMDKHGHCTNFNPYRSKSCICPCHVVKVVPTARYWDTVGLLWSCEGCNEGSKGGFEKLPEKKVFAEARRHRLITGHVTFVNKLFKKEVGTEGARES